MLEKLKKIISDNPNLRAKDLAKMLGTTKDQINPILYKHNDIFKVSEDYTWSLTEHNKLIITFNKRWVDCDSFEDALLAIGSPLENDSIFVTFVFADKCNFLLEALARFLALCNQLCELQKKVLIDFQSSMASFHYFNRLGFFDHLDARIEVLPKKPELSTAQIYKGKSETLVELGEVDPCKTNKALINQLTDYFVHLSSSMYDNAASTIFGELIGNIKEHSQSKIFGLAGLQKYNGRRKHIQTIVSDSGVGIARTLRSSLEIQHPKLFKKYSNQTPENDIALVKEALSKGEISRYGAGRGLGFKSSKEQAVRFNAEFSVRQESFALKFIFKNGSLESVMQKKNLVKILGTHICFDFYVD